MVRGRIKFSNGAIISFNENNYQSVINDLTDNQKQQLASILLNRLGPKTEPEFAIDQDAYDAWYESVHRDDIMMGGGAKNDSSKINKKGGKKQSLKSWNNKGEAERNIVWLRSEGFRSRWNKEVGYTFYRMMPWGIKVEIPTEWLYELSHDLFRVKVSNIIVEVE